MEKPIFTLESHLTLADYNHYQYLATFLVNRRSVPNLLLIGLVLAMVVGYTIQRPSPLFILPLWLALSALMLGIRWLQVVLRNRKREKNQSKTTQPPVLWRFYSEKMTSQHNEEEEKSLPYEEVSQFTVSKDFFIFQASEKRVLLLCKRDTDQAVELEVFLRETFSHCYRKLPFEA